MVILEADIELTLRPLVGLPLSDMRRFAVWQRFEFGLQKPFVNTKGQDTTIADYAIQVACDWRIVGPLGIVAGSNDYGPGSERHDASAMPFFRMLAQTAPIVQAVRADAVGSVHLTMTGGYSLNILPMGVSQETRWIFLTPSGGTFTLDEQGFGA